MSIPGHGEDDPVVVVDAWDGPVTFRTSSINRPLAVPERLWRVEPTATTGVVALPSHLFWSPAGARFDLSDRRTRRLVYSTVMLEGRPEDVAEYVDGELLDEMWDDELWPRDIGDFWRPAVNAYREASAQS
ncbi:hypothetical protein G5C66_18100 [Nocardioides sp. KC13]|uniref:Uncharacterized protein n=1 Tax=Nocardioides turkmenicus TaxID=2711220 RepID=A0A6M1QXC6_9ACTN|nr:hypothetical protein [Nocardioides sp. KC13]NGN94643.1 hypothetical protein [Nocardioides sp. KC13]